MYYIENNDKPSYFAKIFNIIKFENNKFHIPLTEKTKNNKIIKLAKKMDKLLKCCNSNKIVLSKYIFQNEIFKNLLYSYGYDIVDGKWLFEALIDKVVDFIAEKRNMKKEETSISILVNNLSDYTLENIIKFSKEFKTLNIVTNHIEKFKTIQDKIYQENGLMITVSNNKKKSLAKSEIIINIDFQNELLNKYNIYENATIVNIYHAGKIKRKRFNGIVINDYEICLNENELLNFNVNFEKYFIKHLYEGELYRKYPYIELKKKIKDDGIEIESLFTLTGVY